MALNKMELFKLDIVSYLGDIEDTCKRWNLPMSQITLIVRAPENDEMFVVLTTESPEGLREATELALSKPGVKHGA